MAPGPHPSIVDRFRILRQLGAGGMGVVYQAEDLERQAVVALKTLPKLEADALYQFKREFRLLAGIAHPNLVTLYGLFAQNDEWFITMEYVEGVNFLASVQPGAAHMPEPSVVNEITLTAPVESIHPPIAAIQRAPCDPARLRAILSQIVEGSGRHPLRW